MSEWIGRRVVVRVAWPCTVSDINGEVSGTVIEESETMVKVKLRVFRRWYPKTACEFINEADHD